MTTTFGKLTIAAINRRINTDRRNSRSGNKTRNQGNDTIQDIENWDDD